MRKVLFIMILPLLLISCTSRAEKLQTKKEIETHQSAAKMIPFVKAQADENEKKLRKFISELPLEKKIAQLFIENLEGNTKFRSYENYSSITENGDNTPLVAGGYLFFSYNLCNSPSEQLEFMKSIQTYCKDNSLISPYLAIDQEGGWVNRLKKLTGGLPSQEEVAKTQTAQQAYSLYKHQSEQMNYLGFHMNLAPVIEVCTDDNRNFLDGRSFGNAEQTVTYGIPCVLAYENTRTAAVIKHFPGNTNTDPHTGLPEIKLSKDELFKSLEPFRQVLQAKPEGVLMSHARTSAIDSQTPACLSYEWVTKILREEFNYDGIIFSDDIFMGALASNGYPPEKAAVMAIDAGVNCIMTSEKRFGKQAKMIYKHALENEEFSKKIDDSVYRILRFKQKHGIFEL